MVCGIEDVDNCPYHNSDCQHFCYQEALDSGKLFDMPEDYAIKAREEWKK